MKRKYYFISTLFLLVVFLLQPAFAGQTGKINGVVKDKKTGELLIGVNMRLENQQLGAVTDFNGFYTILNIPPGTYTLIASYVGYGTVRTTDIVIAADRTVTIDLEMDTETALVTQEIVISAKRDIVKKDITSSELSVSSLEIKNLPVENLGDILKLKAGIVTDGSGNIHIRGGRSSEVGFLVDGVSVSDNYTGSGKSNVDIQFLEEVKVISGVFNAEYGQALSGIVDIITKQGTDRIEGNLNLSTGDYVSNGKNIFYNIGDVKPWSINDIKASLSGPLNLFGSSLKFNLAFRRYESEGWLYGQRRFNVGDSSYQIGDTYYINATGDNAPVSLNNSLNYNLQAKLSYDVSSFLKLSNLFFFDRSENQYYNHVYKLNPDGLPTNYTDSYNNILTSTFLFSSNTFMTVKYSLGWTRWKGYVFEDPVDSRYVNPELLRQLTAYSFFTGGVDFVHYQRTTTTHMVKADLLSQIDRYNEAKTGIEVKLTTIDIFNGSAIYKGNSDYFDYNQYLNSGTFTHTPLSIAGYIQDKFEYQSIVVNAGLRLDYFDSKGVMPDDPKDPEHSTKSPAETQFQISPRLGLAFPISADGTIHISYGHFFQIPPYEFLYANPNFRVGPGGLYTLMGNASLKAQSTVSYEIGLHYSFFDVIGLEVTGFFKDITNLLGTEVRDTYIRSDRYAVYMNRDYGKSRGFTISVFKQATEDDHVSVSVDYTLQIAEGNASDPNDSFNKSQGNPPKKPNIQVVPLNWDQRHTLNVSAFYVIPGDFSVGIIGKYESGFPYTPEIQSIETSFENSARMPAKVNVDLQFFKDLTLGGTTLSFFVKIYNLFDQRNEYGVFRDTGRAGYSLVTEYTPQQQGPNTLNEYLVRPDFYSEPRRIVLGINYNFNF